MKTKTMQLKKIKPGTVLLSEKPFAYAVKSKLRGERCDNCLQQKQLLKCSSCQYVYYCNRECQKQGWTDHKMECSNLKRVAPKIVPDAARIIARIIFKLQRGGDLEKGYYTEKKFRVFRDLMSHYSDIKKDEKRMEHFMSLCGVLTEFIGESNMPNTAELMGIYGRLCVNGFSILDPEMVSIGTGIYLGVSVIDHSCDPNAVAVFEGTTIFIRALKDMPQLDWTKVRISYIELLNFPEDRQAELQATYYFLCDCGPCNNPLQLESNKLMMCPNQNCNQGIPVKHQVQNGEELQPCCSCGEHIKMERYKEYIEVEDFVKAQIQNMKEITYLDVCKVCLKKLQGLFHPLDLLYVKVQDLAFESSIDMSLWEETLEYGPELVAGYKKYYGENHPLLGILYMKLGKISLHLNKPETAFTTLKEAEKVLCITHGEKHTLYQQQLLPLLLQAQEELQRR